VKDEKEKRPWFRFVDLADDEAEISLFDEIGGWGQSVEDFKAEFDKIKGRKSIHLNINSPGGVVTDGWAIYNILSRVKDRLTVEVVGLAASMGSVVALAGKELIMDRGTYLMIHDPWTFAIGTSEDLRKMASTMDQMKEDIINLYTERSALTRDEIIKMMADETWISAADAVEYGFASRVEETAQAAACLNIEKYGFRKAPLALLASHQDAETAPETKETVMDENTIQTQSAQVAAPQAGAPGLDLAQDENFLKLITDKVAPVVLKMVPAGRALENQVRSDKVSDLLVPLLMGRFNPKDSAAIIKTTDGFGIPTVAMPDFLANLNFYSIARRWGAQVFGAPSGSLTFTADVIKNAAAIIAEAGSYADKGEPSAVTMALVKVGGRYSITEEATEDTVLERFAIFQKLAAVAIAKAENDLFLTGTGSSQPKGIFVETATKTAASASAITYAELVAFDELLGQEWGAVGAYDPNNPATYRGPVYVMHSTTAAVLRALNDSGTPPIYYFEDRMHNSPFATLFGKPVIRDSNCPEITNSAKVIACVNFGGYAIGERRPNLALKVTENADTHATNWDFAERIDGKLWDTSALELLAMHA